MSKLNITKGVNRTFTLYIGNRIDQKTKVFETDLRQQYQKWLFKKEIEWLEYVGREMSVRLFITDKDGLNSTFEEKEFNDIMGLLKKDYDSALAGTLLETKTF